MRLFFITDIHSTADTVFSNVKMIKELKPDLILLGGDYEDYHYPSYLRPEIQVKNQQYINALIQVLQPIAKTYYVLGNHDCNFNVTSPHFISDTVELTNNLVIIGQSGSSSCMIRKGPMESGCFWNGNPHGPRKGQEGAEEFHKFQNSRIEMNRQLIDSGENKMLPPTGPLQYNIAQTLPNIPSGKQAIILTHQGPYCSMTSAERRYGPTYSAGSPQFQFYYDANKENIVCWLHGHDHLPKHNISEKIVNPGALEYGNYVLIEIEEVQGKWEMIMQTFGKLAK